VATHAVMNHTNTRVPYGVLEHLIVSPRIHHGHHSTDKKAYDKNFAVHFPWLDRLFGSHYAPSNEWPKEVGLDDAVFPKGFIQQHLDPFLRNPEIGQPKGDPSTR
jgi:lathosterol oxidase